MRGDSEIPSDWIEAGEGPAGVIGDELVAGSGEAREKIGNARVGGRAGIDAGIAQSDAGVADESSPLRAFHRAFVKHLPEFFFAERSKPFEIRREQAIARGERGFAG